MPKRFGVNYAIMAIVLDYGLTMLALIIAVALRPILPQIPFLVPVQSLRIPALFYLGIPFLWVFVFLIAAVYDPKRNHRIVDEILSVALATGLATMVFAGVLYLLFRDFSRWLFVIFILLDLFFLLGWRIIARYIAKVIYWPARERRVLVVGAGEVGKQVETMLDEYHWEGLTFFGYTDDDEKKVNEQAKVLGKITDTKSIVAEKKISDVVITLPQRANGRINDLIIDLLDLPVQVRVVPDYFSLALHKATVNNFGALPMINLRDPALTNFELAVKRIFDLILCSFTTLIALPLLGLTAVLIKLDSTGPVFFRQRRVGENGRIFNMYKFRSMIDGAESMQHKMLELNENGEILFKREDDPRVTRLGRILRRTSLDELPQLLNVLKGDMSLVGPRPELPWLVEHYDSWQRKRFAVPQGITGWWQVNGRSTRPMHLHTADDLYYVQNYSVWLDLYILIKTVLVVLRGTGAY